MKNVIWTDFCILLCRLFTAHASKLSEIKSHLMIKEEEFISSGGLSNNILSSDAIMASLVNAELKARQNNETTRTRCHSRRIVIFQIICGNG